MKTVTREFLIVLSKKDALVAELERLAKRARRIGAAAIAWSFGAVEEWLPEEPDELVLGPTPRID